MLKAINDIVRPTPPPVIRSQAPTETAKWEVPFDGSNNRGSVQDFVFKVEYLKSLFQCPWDEILSNFHVLVTGRAREW
ncbi:GH23721 [Drosophila grimshawi]|uniref:GH23721 n=1 Tax=Drosophila grimshawi TaxID=7222 RepID=B4K497_DROGR|nr:GH23721 [Drosophila grimshawi]